MWAPAQWLHRGNLRGTRAELKPVLFASSLAPGGILMNYRGGELPRIHSGHPGPELMERTSVSRLSVSVQTSRYQDVERSGFTGDVKKVYTADSAVHLKTVTS